MEFAKTYPEDAVKRHAQALDYVALDQVQSLGELFLRRVERSPQKIAYQQYDRVARQWRQYRWQEVSDLVDIWRKALAMEDLSGGDRVAVRLRNCLEWVLFDQAAMALGLVLVPIYVEDRADNIAYILQQTESKVLLLETPQQWAEMSQNMEQLQSLRRIIILQSQDAASAGNANIADNERVSSLPRWLSAAEGAAGNAAVRRHELNRNDLASIVYTSGTTGRPKGVMLSHWNMLANAAAGLKSVAVFPDDRFLSFLPLSHMFERTVGYILTMMAGVQVTFNRSIEELTEDLAIARPTILVSVPRVFEKAYNAIKTQVDEGSALKRKIFNLAVAVGWQKFMAEQGRASWKVSNLLWPLLDRLVARKVTDRFGGELRLVICGGAKLTNSIAKLFTGLGIRVLQGYGLTESSPVLSVNTLEQNKPESIGLPLHGAQLAIAENGELLAKSDFTMLGYWQNEQATAEAVTADGWLKTGDVAEIDAEGFIHITGRIKEIIVLANGEKIPPADMEGAICDDGLFEQVLVLGEGRPYLTAIIVVNGENWSKKASDFAVAGDDVSAFERSDIQEYLMGRIAERLSDFPGYAFIRRALFTLHPWTVEDGSLTPTLKVRRTVLAERYASAIEAMYQSHQD